MYRWLRTWRRITVVFLSVMFLFVGRAFYLLGDAQAQAIGLVFFGLALNGFLTAGIYFSDWFIDLDASMKIITLVWVAPFVGWFAGYLLDSFRAATFGVVIATLVADAIAIPTSIYLYLRDKKEEREYEEEMEKYGKEP